MAGASGGRAGLQRLDTNGARFGLSLLRAGRCADVMGARIVLLEVRRLVLAAGCGFVWGVVTNEWQQALTCFLVVLL